MSSLWWCSVGWLGIFAILASAHFIAGAGGFPGWVALVPVAGTVVALIAETEHPNRGIGVVLNTPPFQTLGRLSYSWYLWHWPFLVFAAALTPTITVAGKVAAVVASLAVAGISYRFVENPIRFHP